MKNSAYINRHFSGVLMLAGVLALLPTVLSADISTTWRHEWARGMPLSQDQTQKFESVIEPEWQHSTGEQDWTARLRLRVNSETDSGSFAERAANYSSMNGALIDSKHVELSLREFYVDGEVYEHASLPDMEWRVGKQQVVWGQADGLKVLDQVNPQSYREFILESFEDSRIPLWMVNLTLITGEASTLQLLWVPDTSYHELAQKGSLFEISAAERVPIISPLPGQSVSVAEINKPSRAFKDSDVGVRYKVFWDGWDITLNYLHHTLDTPVFYQDQSASAIQIQPDYERSHLLGASFSNVFGEVIVRAELGYQTDTYHYADTASTSGVNHHQELASVLGLDWQGIEDTLISVQWFRSQLFSYQGSTIREQTDQTLSFLFRKHFDNQSWKTEILALHSLNHEDGLIRPKASYLWLSNLEVWLGADVFYGERNGLYGQFDRNDRLVAGFEWGF